MPAKLFPKNIGRANLLPHSPAAMRGLKLANVRVINLLGGAMAINYGEKPV
jgi:hypothetical protein